MEIPDFTRRWINLAQPQLGCEVIYASDEFFAPKERLLNPEEPVFIPDKYDDHGKWMDGWETRRRRCEGYDYCIIHLETAGVIHGVDIDTRHFTGNFPPSASIEVCLSDTAPNEKTSWVTLLPSQTIRADDHNYFSIDSPYPWNYIRLNIYPDGGVARLRLYGEISPNFEQIKEGELIDLVGVKNGGRAIICNNEHFGTMHNIIKPQPPANMGDGWETRRRRKPGYDWAVYSLCCVGLIEKIVVETIFFKGNSPEKCSIQGSLFKGGSEETISTQSMFWPLTLDSTKLQANSSHTFTSELVDIGPISHIRLNIFPDGGISRLRVYGRPYEP